MNKKSIRKNRIIASLLVIALSISMMASVFLLTGCVKQLNIVTEIKEQNFNKLKVGVISDTQFPQSYEGDIKTNQYYINFKKALSVLKFQGVNLIIFAGDITDLVSDFSYDSFNQCITEVFGTNKPLFQFVMGNHDYWSKPSKPVEYYREMFQSKMQQSPWTHYKLNGYHFIGVSPSSGNMSNGYGAVTDWLDRELAIAQKDSPDKPIFVTTHNQPKDTSYGSDDWGDKRLDKIFKKYPNVVNFSGHVHYSLLDERSIWQENYTVINTQSLSYTEMEKGKENGSIPPNADKTPMGYILDFSYPRIEIKRWDFLDGLNGIESKADMRWELPLPYSKDSFLYTAEKKKAKNSSPVFDKLDYTDKSEADGHSVTFAAARDNDFVHSYKVVVNNKKTYLYFSDFYNGLTRMSETVTLKIPMASSKIKSIKIYALDSYNKISPQCIVINK